MLSDAIDEVARNIKSFGDIVLPDDRDPYVEDTYAAKAPKGGYICMQSPKDGPAYGRKLTWGNVRDALLGLSEMMVKEGKRYKTEFSIRHDLIGIIGEGSVSPGGLSSPSAGLGGSLGKNF